jgi:hypothetical protein
VCRVEVVLSAVLKVSESENRGVECVSCRRDVACKSRDGERSVYAHESESVQRVLLRQRRVFVSQT